MNDTNRSAQADDDDTWQVVIVKHGTRETTRSDAFLNYAYYGEPDGPHRVDYYFWVLRRGGRVVIVDTGYSASEGRKRHREILIDPMCALRSLGIDPEAGHPVIVTHAHYDHIGNIDAFSNSPIYISRPEWEFWTDDIADRTLFSHFSDPTAVRELTRACEQDRLHVFDVHCNVAPGVEVSVLGGHTPGQAVVSVSTSVGPILLASDAVHFHEEIDRDMLFQSMTDLPQSYRALDQLRRLPRRSLVSGHDSGELSRHIPLDGALAGLAATIGDFR